jgi:hypothetical protein
MCIFTIKMSVLRHNRRNMLPERFGKLAHHFKSDKYIAKTAYGVLCK